MNARHALVALVLAAAPAACGGVPYVARPAPVLSPEVTAGGESIYFGKVYPLAVAAAEPTFVYERRAGEREGAWVSTHITRTPSGDVAFADSATHSADYALTGYALHADQLGRSGTIRVDRGVLTFRLVDAGQERVQTEHPKGDVVVGPTLVGYISRRMDRLRAGEAFDVRLAVLERLETLGFELRSVAAEPGHTRVRMKPTNLLVGLVVGPIDYTFDTASGRLLRVEGRVPPKVRDGGWLRDFDARVEYTFVAQTYR